MSAKSNETWTMNNLWNINLIMSKSLFDLQFYKYYAIVVYYAFKYSACLTSIFIPHATNTALWKGSKGLNKHPSLAHLNQNPRKWEASANYSEGKSWPLDPFELNFQYSLFWWKTNVNILVIIPDNCQSRQSRRECKIFQVSGIFTYWTRKGSCVILHTVCSLHTFYSFTQSV